MANVKMVSILTHAAVVTTILGTRVNAVLLKTRVSMSMSPIPGNYQTIMKNLSKLNIQQKRVRLMVSLTLVRLSIQPRSVANRPAQ